MNWEVDGVWGDENMPNVELLESFLFGTRFSPVIDIAEAIEYLGIIRSGRVYWTTNYPKYSLLDLEYSLDGGETYKKPLGFEQSLPGVNNEMLLRLKVNLRSGVSDILPQTRLEVYEIGIILSDKPDNERWDEDSGVLLKWNEVTV